MSRLSQTCQNILLCILLLLLTFIPFSVISQQSVESERQVLLELKEQWGIQSWDSAVSHCNWSGIECANNSVTGISLSYQGIAHKIPAPICALTNLITLNLSCNSISGGFPTVLYNCTKLQKLDLFNNSFTGPLTNDIHKLSSLEVLDIGFNSFSGDIPSSIGQLTQLTTLVLEGNQFDGTFPPEIGNLMNLEVLDISLNGFIPTKIPDEFGRLKKLRELSMGWCNLVAEILDGLANLSSLEYLDLEDNNLEGGIPSGLFQLKNLTILYLGRNNLSGEIPKSIEAKHLTKIELAQNNLRGAVPEEFGKLQKLKTLLLYGNQLSGELPPELGLHSKLESFDIQSNQFSGELPRNLCAGGVFSYLYADSNNLSGVIPESLTSCDTLSRMGLSYNGLSGEIPSGLWKMATISEMDLRGNKFMGKLPSQLSPALTWLDLSNNNFSGPIPSSIANWRNLVMFQASNNHFSGNIPLEITALSNISVLELDGNQLSGGLPSRIVSWKSLSVLGLANNNLSGQLPVALSSLQNLNCLQLSNNNFSGQIPPEFWKLKLSTLNLSYNHLSGKIPSAFDSMSFQTSFLNNSNLCSDTQAVYLPKCSSQHSHKRVASRYLGMILLPGAVIFLVILYFIFTKFNVSQQTQHDTEQPAWTMISFHNLNFTEEEIQIGLTEDNVIGSGGSGKIYAIEINDSGGKVAAKRIWNSRRLNIDLEKQFLAEIDILGRIRHCNIVKLLCCVSSEDSKLLVYEYMENQSLDKLLYGGNESSTALSVNSAPHIVVLDWPMRIRIAIGAAKGLCYMHHDCSPPIIHRDVKSSNILLDSEFNAKVADFGLAKMALKTGEPYTASAVAGSFGYIAPEYWRTRRLNDKIDVYSFGVVLLELATGKHPCKGNDHLNLADWSWQHYSEGHPINDALDEDIIEPRYLEDMVNFFKLGLMCTNKFPTSRPSMKRVLQLLGACNHHDNTGWYTGGR